MRQPAVTKIQNSSSPLAIQALQFYRSRKRRLFAVAVRLLNLVWNGLSKLVRILVFGVEQVKMNVVLSSDVPSELVLVA
jgi:hypothetical protein